MTAVSDHISKSRIRLANSRISATYRDRPVHRDRCHRSVTEAGIWHVRVASPNRGAGDLERVPAEAELLAQLRGRGIHGVRHVRVLKLPVGPQQRVLREEVLDRLVGLGLEPLELVRSAPARAADAVRMGEMNHPRPKGTIASFAEERGAMPTRPVDQIIAIHSHRISPGRRAGSDWRARSLRTARRM